MENWENDINARSKEFTVETFCDNLFIVQDETDSLICGEDYLETGTCASTGKPLVPHYAILDELCELLGSKDWKHWKHGAINEDNIITEIIDILHFLPPLTMVMNKSEGTTYGPGHMASKLYSDGPSPFLYTGYDEEGMFDSILILGGMVVSTSLSIKNEFYSDNELGPVLYMFNTTVFSLLIQCMVYLDRIKGMNLDGIWEEYIIKNKLNLLRSEQGYKTGGYIKSWGGFEDNVIARAIYHVNNKDSNFKAGDFYKELERVYLDHVVLTNSVPVKYLIGE